VVSFTQITPPIGPVLPASAHLPRWWTSRAATRMATQPWRQVGWEATGLAWRGGDRRVTFVRRP